MSIPPGEIPLSYAFENGQFVKGVAFIDDGDVHVGVSREQQTGDNEAAAERRDGNHQHPDCSGMLDGTLVGLRFNAAWSFGAGYGVGVRVHSNNGFVESTAKSGVRNLSKRQL